MSEDRRGNTPVGTDETLTPSQAIGVEQTSAATPQLGGGSAAITGTLPSRYGAGMLLGAGGMGEVVLARDRQIDRDVAIKRMRMAPTGEAKARFEREAKIQGRLDHPAIVPVHELATDSEGRPFFVMKRLTGTTLAEIIAARTPITRQKLLRAFADVCLAVEFAHERGVIHRDLKPANVMLGNYGEVYVLDWGVARLVDERDTVTGEEPTAPQPDLLASRFAAGAVTAVTGDGATAHAGDSSSDSGTAVGAILGTPGYIAPELLRGQRVDRRADVYGLGCILFEILCNAPLLPRGRAALDAALGAIEARPSARGAQDVPPELDALCVDATEQDPAKRPTARQVAERIEKYLDGDRDVALRKSVSADHASAARAALAAGDGQQERATAMREAGRAIAIDPKNSDAAALVAQLMLEPPREVPAEVDARVEEIEGVTIREKVRLMVGVELSFLLFLPLLFVMGVRSTTALVVFVGGVIVNILATVYAARRDHTASLRELYAAALLFAGLVGTVAHLFSPFLMAPAMGAVSVMMFVVDPRTRWVPLSLLFLAAVIVPWALEALGVLPTTMYQVGGDIALHSGLANQKLPEALVGLIGFSVALMAISGYVGARLAQAQRRAVRAIELQAWHLRQLVA